MINSNLILASDLHQARLADINRHLTGLSRLAVRKDRKIRRNHRYGH